MGGFDANEHRRAGGQFNKNEAEEFPRPINGAAGEETEAVDWDPPIPFDQSAPLPPFPLDSLSTWLRQFVEAVAAQVQVPCDLVALLSLTAVAAACAKRVRVQASDGHSEPTNLYGLAVMEPGERKSETFRLVTDPFRRKELEEIEQRRPLIEAIRAEQEINEARITALKRVAAKPNGGAEAENALQDVKLLAATLALQAEPTLPRLIADDATQEVLARLLFENGERLALFAAEGNVFGIAGGRYAKNRAPPNLSIFLHGWSGDAIRIDRMSRDPIYLDSPHLSIGMTIQRQVLREIAAIDGAFGKGLPARFLYSLPTTRIGTRQCFGTKASDNVIADYDRNLLALLQGLANGGERMLRLSPAALREFAAFFDRIEAQCRDGSALSSPTLRAYASKLQGMTLRLMGVLHMAECGPSAQEEVSEGTAKAAVALADYFLAHARVAFDEMGIDEVADLVRRASVWIVREGRTRFTKRDLHRALHVQKAIQLDPVLQELEARAWISPAAILQASPGRRRRPDFLVNPAVLA